MRRRGTIRLGLTALAASALLVLPQMAQAAPSEEEIAAAQAAEEAAKMSVAEIEVKLAEVNASAATATQNAQMAGEDLNEAKLALDEATKTADKASSDADAAEAAFQEGKQQIASVAQTAYRGGGGTLDSLAPYLDSDGLRSVETKQAGINSFSSSAEAKMQNVAALEQVAKVTRDAANAARDSQQAATDEVQARTDAANKAASDAQNRASIVAAQRDSYVQELATKQNTTVDLINQREAALEAERQEAARVAAEQAALTASDRIVLQFPVYWYSCPPLLKKWEDDVLTHGWAYGSTGTALHGKELLLAVSVGGAGSAYGREGAHIYTIHEFLRPMQGTSRVIGTKYAVPFLSVGALEITDEAIARRAQDYAAVLQTPELPLLDIFG